MATELFQKTATIPAGTPIAAPIVIDISIPAMVTERVEWHVPKGAAGLMGWRLTSGGAQVLPKNLGAWVVTAGESGQWQIEGLHDSGKWEVTAYNTGAFSHTVYVRLHASPAVATYRWPRPAPLPLDTLTSAPDLTKVPPAAFTSRRIMRAAPFYQGPI